MKIPFTCKQCLYFLQVCRHVFLKNATPFCDHIKWQQWIDVR